jgi:hypothetical protein
MEPVLQQLVRGMPNPAESRNAGDLAALFFLLGKQKKEKKACFNRCII